MSYGCTANTPRAHCAMGPPLPARDAAIRQAPRYACARQVSNVRAPDVRAPERRAREQPELFCEELRAGFRTLAQIGEQPMLAFVSAPLGDNVVGAVIASAATRSRGERRANGRL